MRAGAGLIILCCYALVTASCSGSGDHAHNEQFIEEQQAVAQHTVLLNNSDQSIPLRDLQNLKIASVNIGTESAAVFDSILNKYTAVASFSIVSYSPGSRSMEDLKTDLKPYNTIIIQVTDQSLNSPGTLPFILEIQKDKHLIVSLAGDAASLKMLDLVSAPVIWSAKKTVESADFSAQLVFGGVPAVSKLGQNVSARYSAGSGYTTDVSRLKYTVPEDAGVNVSDLSGIDDIAKEAIRKRAAPSVTVMVVKDGKVIFNKGYGTHSYTDQNPTKITDIYDLASVTKTSATTLAVMKLFEEGKLRLDTNLGAYIAEARKSTKNKITLKDLMLHQAGLVSFIPFHRNLRKSDYSSDSSGAYPTKVADKYFLRKGYFKEVMWPGMLESKLARPGSYVYSDLSMYFMKEVVERQSGERLEDYVQHQFYKPLGMTTAGFNPWKRFGKERLIPTENDLYFRKTLLQGYVHDQGAALAGGVAGHAGLFSTANDLAILYQMLLNRGSYGGVEYFKPGTVDLFTSRQSAVSRRGLGFDGWDPKSKVGFPSRHASQRTYGHTGYTGTCVWVDPEYKLIYIFLSNRINPEINDKLSQLNIRGRIQDLIYEAIKKEQR